jgi:hypothetical protein
MQSNYTKYFQDTFQSKRFHSHWKELAHVRVRVAHNGLLMQADLRNTVTHLSAVEEILDVAEARIAMVQLTERDQDHLIQIQEPDAPVEEINPTEEDYSDLLPKLTVLGKIDLGTVPRDTPNRRIIEKEPEDEDLFIIEPHEFLEALEEYKHDPKYDLSRYLALTTLLNLLEDEGYDRQSCLRMAYQLQKEGKIEIYEYSEPFWLSPAKAVRLVPSSPQ